MSSQAHALLDDRAIVVRRFVLLAEERRYLVWDAWESATWNIAGSECSHRAVAFERGEWWGNVATRFFKPPAADELEAAIASVYPDVAGATRMDTLGLQWIRRLA